MNLKDKNDRSWLLETAQKIAEELRVRRDGTGIRIRRPKKAQTSDTDGWLAVIGNLGKGRPGIEIWLDRYTGYPKRKYYVGFQSGDRKAIQKLVHCSKALLPVRELTDKDFTKTAFKKLKAKLPQEEFNQPVFESYVTSGNHFFGLFDFTQESVGTVAKSLIESAIAFILDVANSLPVSKAEAAKRKIDAQNEPKKWVKAHLRRERSRLLALACKRRDHYKCQVCEMTFSAVYGKELGDEFAEAHHIKPLAGAPKKAKTKLDDLKTVCSNCHRMLHRMNNEPGDLKRLRSIVKKVSK